MCPLFRSRGSAMTFMPDPDGTGLPKPKTELQGAVILRISKGIPRFLDKVLSGFLFEGNLKGYRAIQGEYSWL